MKEKTHNQQSIHIKRAPNARCVIICFLLFIAYLIILVSGGFNNLNISIKSLALDNTTLGTKENPFDNSTSFIVLKNIIEDADDNDSFYFKSGCYIFENSVAITKYISIVGVGNDEIEFLSKEKFRHFEINVKSSLTEKVSFENIAFIGNDNDQTTVSGGISIASGRVKVSNSSFISNKSARGGAIFSSSSDEVEIDSCSFSKNEATSRGGAINAVNVNIINSSIIYNNALNSGGGIYLSGKNCSVAFSTIYNNNATNNSGGVYSSYTLKAFYGNIVVGNLAEINGDMRVSNNENTTTGFTGAPHYNIIGYNAEKEITENSIFGTVEDSLVGDINSDKFVMIRLGGKAYNCFPINNDIDIPKVDQRGYPRGDNAMDEHIDIGAIEFRLALDFKISDGYVTKLESDVSFSVFDYINGLWDEDIIAFNSSVEAVATISNSGVVAILSKGKTDITLVTASGEVAICELIISGQTPPIEKIIPSKTEIIFSIGETQKLTVASVPEDAKTPVLIWSSSNTDVATVSADGVVMAVGKGGCVLTVLVAESSIMASCQVTVLPPMESISLSHDDIALFIGGDSFILTYNFHPSNATGCDVTWSTSDINVATISSSGLVTPIGKGTCIVTVKTLDNKYSAPCFVQVSQPEPATTSTTSITTTTTTVTSTPSSTSSTSATTATTTTSTSASTNSSSATTIATTTASLTSQTATVAVTTVIVEDGGNYEGAVPTDEKTASSGPQAPPPRTRYISVSFASVLLLLFSVLLGIKTYKNKYKS